jgi:hypothetical protein
MHCVRLAQYEASKFAFSDYCVFAIAANRSRCTHAAFPSTMAYRKGFLASDDRTGAHAMPKTPKNIAKTPCNAGSAEPCAQVPLRNPHRSGPSFRRIDHSSPRSIDLIYSCPICLSKEATSQPFDSLHSQLLRLTVASSTDYEPTSSFSDACHSRDCCRLLIDRLDAEE